MSTATPDKTYRPGLPGDMPARIRKLPTYRGYPVPWFVAWVDPDDNDMELATGAGVAEFRVIRTNGIPDAWNKKRCWICGEQLGKFKTFAAGPMCGVNRTSAEPPSHLDCADWAARACPFLTRPDMKRREAGMPERAQEDEVAGIMLKRNPGVCMVWTTTEVTPFSAANNGGVLFRMGSPEHVRWYREGREANYAEVLHSIETGLPALKEVAQLQPGGEAELQKALEYLLRLLPSESTSDGKDLTDGPS